MHWEGLIEEKTAQVAKESREEERVELLTTMIKAKASAGISTADIVKELVNIYGVPVGDAESLVAKVLR